MVIEPGTPQLRILQSKPERLNQMQPSARVGAKPNDVTGVGGDLRMNQNDIEHQDSLTIWASGAQMGAPLFIGPNGHGQQPAR